jgi:single-strand DNA-binding protein
MLIGNLTRDPELRYTPTGSAVCTIGLATNRTWTTESGEKKDEVEYHRVVAWAKLAELCSQLLTKGRKIYVEGRLRTNQWTGQDGAQRNTTEIVMEDMMILDPKPARGEEGSHEPYAPAAQSVSSPATPSAAASKPAKSPKASDQPSVDEHVDPDDIPF